jgi:hypothetical protein
MSLVTTVAGTTSNAYASLEDVEENLYGTALTKWRSLADNVEREALVKRATIIIDMQTYRGDLYDSAQSLKFPRNYHYTTDDEDVDTPYLPPSVTKALYAQVTAMLNGFGEGFTDQILEYRSKGVSSVSLGVGSSMQFDKRTPSARDFLCAEARVLLAPFFMHRTIRVERG